jgi:hypothetical protein
LDGISHTALVWRTLVGDRVRPTIDDIVISSPSLAGIPGFAVQGILRKILNLSGEVGSVGVAEKLLGSFPCHNSAIDVGRGRCRW